MTIQYTIAENAKFRSHSKCLDQVHKQYSGYAYK